MDEHGRPCRARSPIVDTFISNARPALSLVACFLLSPLGVAGKAD